MAGTPQSQLACNFTNSREPPPAPLGVRRCMSRVMDSPASIFPTERRLARRATAVPSVGSDRGQPRPRPWLAHRTPPGAPQASGRPDPTATFGLFACRPVTDVDDDPSSTPSGQSPGAVHRWVVARPHAKPAHHALTALLAILGVAALAVGLLSLWHPVAFWPFGVAHTSDAPPVFGVGILVFPVVLLGIAVRRIWWALSLDLEAWKQHRRSDRRAR